MKKLQMILAISLIISFSGCSNEPTTTVEPTSTPETIIIDNYNLFSNNNFIKDLFNSKELKNYVESGETIKTYYDADNIILNIIEIEPMTGSDLKYLLKLTITNNESTDILTIDLDREFNILQNYISHEDSETYYESSISINKDKLVDCFNDNTRDVCNEDDNIVMKASLKTISEGLIKALDNAGIDSSSINLLK